MTKPIKVGDLVISHTKTLWQGAAAVGRPALVIAMNDIGNLRLKVGSREWWDHRRDCEKVPE